MVLTKIYDVRIDMHYDNKWKIQANLDRQGDYYLIGTYKTKERALEVLDEIQKLLMPQVNIIHNKIEQRTLQDFTSDVIIQPMIEDIQIKQADSYVYEMPKE